MDSAISDLGREALHRATSPKPQDGQWFRLGLRRNLAKALLWVIVRKWLEHGGVTLENAVHARCWRDLLRNPGDPRQGQTSSPFSLSMFTQSS